MSRLDSDEEELEEDQCQVLFDLLTHHQAQREVESLKRSSTLKGFGSPVQAPTPQPSCPLLRMILCKFMLPLPGLQDAPTTFWSGNVAEMATALAEANLSESYDKSAIGIRRTLSTAGASILEVVSRGFLGGFASGREDSHRQTYNLDDAAEVRHGWEDFVQGCVSGDMLDSIFAKTAATEKLSDHEPVVQAAHEHIISLIASFLHYILIISPRGQSLIPLLARAHDMTPYFMIRQTLKVGNAATMLKGMVRIALAKMNMSLMTSWFGGASSDSGMNLLQYIISTVLGWDNNVLKKRASSLEADKTKLPSEQVEHIKSYLAMTAAEQDVLRDLGRRKEWSSIHCINDRFSYTAEISEVQHLAALDYLALQLSIRDRSQLIDVFCYHTPDLLTSSVRSVVAAYEPVIREMHKAVDLSSCMADSQTFLTELINLARLTPAKGKSVPGPQDFYRLLKKHQGNSHRFMHEALKNSRVLAEAYRKYAGDAVGHFRRTAKAPEGMVAAGNFTVHLRKMYRTLSTTDRGLVTKDIEKYGAYLAQISGAEVGRGPGVYLSKWQDRMNQTPITPATATGPLRSGASASVVQSTRVDTDGLVKGFSSSETVPVSSPAVDDTVRLLLPLFQEQLAALGS